MIPLSAEPDFRGSSMSLRVLRDAREEIHPLPFDPYVYSRLELTGAMSTERVERKLLSTRKSVQVWRHEFETNLPVSELNKKFDFQPGPPVLYESHVRYTERVAIDCPGYYRGLPHEKPLRVMILDNEGLTRHGKPLGRNFVGVETDEGEDIWMEIERLGDLARLLSRHDIVVGYNILKYDWPQIERVAVAQRTPLPRNFIHYDLARSVMGDQTLHGIKSRGLKSVARWYGMDAIEVDGRNTAALPLDKLEDYNRSDLKITRGLFNIYFPRLRELASYLGVPLKTVLEEIPSTGPSIISARGLRAKGYISDGTNLTRHPEIRGKVQGAFTTLTPAATPGRPHLTTGKVDVKQLYPNIILNSNLGPDTTWIVGFEDLQPFSIRREGSLAYYRIPDERIGKTVVVAVEESEPSILREYLTELGVQRSQVQALMVGMSEVEKLRSPLYAKSYAIKIGRNTTYGYQLSKEAYFSDLATGIVVTGVGRLFVQSLANEIEQQFPQTVFEVDTDGLYFDGTYNRYDQISELSDAFAVNWAHTALGLPGTFELDHEHYKASFFSATKNYILLDDKDRVIVHGSGLKGHHRPNILDVVIAEVVPKLLNGEPVALKPYYDWKRWRREDYLMRVAMGQALEDYDGNPVSKQIALQYLRHDEPVEVGSILEYYAARKEKSHYFRAHFEEEEFDPAPSYYTAVLNRLFTALGLVSGGTKTIDAAIDYAIDREMAAIRRGLWEPCTMCGGQGEYIARKTLDVVRCGCTNGRRLVVA